MSDPVASDRIVGDWIAQAEVQAVLGMLSGAGHRALLVGGCVRDGLLGRPVRDVDIATDALPDRVMRLCAEAGLRVAPTGIEHGTVTVVVNGIPHEVTTFRRDVSTDGRRAVVAFTDRVEEDAARRDFTMNALYAQGDGRVIDPLGGLPDLRAGRVRFVGDAAARIAEDSLRILRFFRFHAWYADPAQGLDPEGLAACAAGAEGLDRLSRERVGAEIRRLLAAPDPAPAVAAMQAAGVLQRVLPGADNSALAPLVHLEAGRPPHWLLRLAALGGDVAGLRLSRAEARVLDLLRGALTEDRPAVLGYRLGVAMAADAVLARAALTGTPPRPGWQAEVARGAEAEFPVKAADLMPALQGPALGARLRELEDRWLAGDLRLTRGDLLG